MRTATKAADSLTVAARTGGEVNSPRNIINFIRSVRTRGIAAVRTATFRCITFRNRALTLYQIRLADSNVPLHHAPQSGIITIPCPSCGQQRSVASCSAIGHCHYTLSLLRTATFRCIMLRNRALSLYPVPLADSAYDYLCHFDQVSNANARRNLALLIDFSTSALRACGRNDKQGGGRRRMCAARRVLLYTVIYTVIRPAMRACGLSDPQNKPNRNRCSEL